MSDFEDRLGRALTEGAEEAPARSGGVGGLAARARERARRRRALRVSVASGAVVAVVLALVIPFALLRGPGSDSPSISDVGGDGWRTVSFERESSASGRDTVTVLVDVPQSWVEVPDSDDCAFIDYGAPSTTCTEAEAEAVGVYPDSGNLDYSFGPGLRPASDFGYPVAAGWLGYVNVGDIDVNVTSDDYQVAARVLASARLEGQTIPDLSGGIAVIDSDGVVRPEITLDVAEGYGVRVEARRVRDEVGFAEQVDATHWTAAATVGEKRVVVTAPTSAIAELVAGSSRVAEPAVAEPGVADPPDDAWRTVTYEGDPVDESGDATVVFDVPPGWEALEGKGCSVPLVRYGDPAVGCESAAGIWVYSEATLDYVGPGLSDNGESSVGLVVAGRFVVSAGGADYETVRRILASVRQPGDPAPSTTWRTDEVEVAPGTTLDVPDDDSVSVGFTQPFSVRVPASRSARLTRDGTWRALVGIGKGTSLLITAPTQALADVVASTVRSAG